MLRAHHQYRQTTHYTATEHCRCDPLLGGWLGVWDAAIDYFPSCKAYRKRRTKVYIEVCGCYLDDDDDNGSRRFVYLGLGLVLANFSVGELN